MRSLGGKKSKVLVFCCFYVVITDIHMKESQGNLLRIRDDLDFPGFLLL